jgi:hypothetical protein
MAEQTTRIPIWRQLVFPAAIWAVATLFVFGGLGLWNDDYTFSTRDPATGAWSTLVIPQLNPETGEPAFWRPLHFRVTASMITVLWDHHWALQLVQAGVHAAVAWLVYMLARALGVRAPPAAGGAMLFLVHPAAHQAVNWTSALSTAAATGVALTILVLLAHLVRRPRGLAWSALLVPLAFLTPCFNEQPTALLACMPIVAWACATQQPRLRATVPTLLCLAGVAAYLWLYVSTNPASAPGTSGGSIVTDPGELGRKAARAYAEAGQWILLHDFREGAVSWGLETLLAHPIRALGAVVVLAWAWSAAPAVPLGDRGGLRRGTCLWLCAGVGLAASLLPVIAIPQYTGVDSRLLYAPLAMLGLAAAGLLDLLARLPWRAPVAVAATVGAVMFVGVQGARQSRAALDAELAEAFRRDAPAERERSFVHVARLDDRATNTGAWRFDDAFWSPLAYPWASFQFLRRDVYERTDIHAGFRWLWPLLQPVFRVGDEGLRLRYEFAHLWPFQPDPTTGEPGYLLVDLTPRDGPGHLVPWTHVIPIAVDASGRLTVFGSARLERVVGPDEFVQLPAVAGQDQPTLAVPIWDVAGEIARVDGWRTPGSDDLAFPIRPEHTPAYSAAPIAASEVWSAHLPPSEIAQRLHWRVKLASPDSVRAADGLRFVATLDGQRVGTFALSAARERASAGWLRWDLQILPAASARRLDIAAERLLAPARGFEAAPAALMTPGAVLPGEPARSLQQPDSGGIP